MAKQKTKSRKSALIKADPTTPVLKLVGGKLYLRGGASVGGEKFSRDTLIRFPTSGLVAGTDYGIAFGRDEFSVDLLVAAPKNYFAGFHFAPGGNAPKSSGGNSTPAINPCSMWDLKYRPKCSDPRGMAFISPRNCWADIYLTGADHLINGTSKCGVTIADGNDPPQNPVGGRFAKFDYATAIAVMKHHGKALLSIEDGFEALIGVTEQTACGSDPRITGLDAPRTSKFGLMQATGNMWIWCHDGHPVTPRAAILGGSYWTGGLAGSRDAVVGYWPGYSSDVLGARGRGDHLQLV
jgi:hypothetical protein